MFTWESPVLPTALPRPGALGLASYSRLHSWKCKTCFLQASSTLPYMCLATFTTFSELLSHLESQQPQQLCLFLESSAEQHFVHTSLSSSLKQSLLFFGEVEPENGKNIWILQAVLSLQASVSLAVKMGSITGPSRHHGTVGKIPSLYVKMLCDCKVLQSVYQSFFFFSSSFLLLHKNITAIKKEALKM